jgi:hypothetical protein
MTAAPPEQAAESDEGLVACAPLRALAGFEFARQGLVCDERAARHTLRRQIARLERQLAAAVSDDLVAGARGRVASAALAPQAGIGGRLLDLGELEHCRDDMVGLVRQVDDQRTTERVNRGLLLEMYRDPVSHRYRRLETRELAERGCRVYEVVPRFGLVGILGGWWRVKVSSGCPLPA